MTEFTMPSLGADMDSGTIIEWRVGPGDHVRRGDIVALVDTDKSDIEVEIFEDGTVEELLVEPGQEVLVGTPLATIRPDGSTTTPPAIDGHDEQRSVRSSPLARRMAADAGVDLGAVSGSGPGGAVVAADLRTAPAEVPPPTAAPTAMPSAPPVEPPEPGPAGVPRDRRESRARATAELMARSNREIPHYHVATTIDLQAATTWLASTNASRPAAERILPAALLLKATARAAAEVPTCNGTWVDGFRPADAVRIGVVVFLRGGGFVVPTVADADQLAVDDLMATLRDLVTRARAGRLRSSEVAGTTITVTNLGDRGAEEVHGVIHPPQVALVGFGRIVERPWATGGLLGVRPTVRATLAGDHRVNDGHDGSRFLDVVDRSLQLPEEL